MSSFDKSCIDPRLLRREESPEALESLSNATNERPTQTLPSMEPQEPMQSTQLDQPDFPQLPHLDTSDLQDILGPPHLGFSDLPDWPELSDLPTQADGSEVEKFMNDVLDFTPGAHKETGLGNAADGEQEATPEHPTPSTFAPQEDTTIVVVGSNEAAAEGVGFGGSATEGNVIEDGDAEGIEGQEEGTEQQQEADAGEANTSDLDGDEEAYGMVNAISPQFTGHARIESESNVPDIYQLLDPHYNQVDTSTQFTSLADAEEKTRRKVPGAHDAKPDDTIPRHHAQKLAIVKAMLKVMLDVSTAKDSKNMIDSFLKNNEDTQLLELTCWKVLEKAIERQEVGPFLDPKSSFARRGREKGAQPIKTFAERMTAIFQALAQRKSICRQLVSADYVNLLVDEPLAAIKRVDTNKQLNNKKGQLMTAGKRALQEEAGAAAGSEDEQEPAQDTSVRGRKKAATTRKAKSTRKTPAAGTADPILPPTPLTLPPTTPNFSENIVSHDRLPCASEDPSSQNSPSNPPTTEPSPTSLAALVPVSQDEIDSLMAGIEEEYEEMTRVMGRSTEFQGNPTSGEKRSNPDSEGEGASRKKKKTQR